MKEAKIRVTWRFWLRFPHCLLYAIPNLNQWVPTEVFIRLCCLGWKGRAWTCCNLMSGIWRAGLELETDLTSALLSAPRRSGWLMGSNQRQTDLPQETSPHHVYGNQHFSRGPLIAAEGEGEGGEKQLDSPSFSAEKISRLSTVQWPEYDLQACCQKASLNNTATQSLINLGTIAKNVFWEYVTCWFPTAICLKSLQLAFSKRKQICLFAFLRRMRWEDW